MKYHIPTPCPEDWERMKIGLTSRFCESCTKDVIDFTNLSRQEILEYLFDNQGNRTCGRILPSQLDFTRRDIVVTLHQMKKRYPRHQLPIAVLMVAGMMLAGCGGSDGSEERRVKEETKTEVRNEGDERRETVGTKTEVRNESDEQRVKSEDSSIQLPEKPKLENTTIKAIKINSVSVEGETMGFMVMEPDTLISNKRENNLLIESNTNDTISNNDKSIALIGEIVDENSFFRYQNMTTETYISTNFHKKSSKHKNEKIILNVLVDAEGKISDITLIQSVSELLDRYATQLISEMPVWLPAKHNGKKIKSNVKIEITVPGMFEKAKVKVLE
jgi:hypothetical protein